MMKIVHVIGSYDPAKGGPQAVVVRLAAAQASLGHEVTIVSYCDDEVSSRAAKAALTIPGFDKVRTLLLAMPDLRETLFGEPPRKPWKRWCVRQILSICMAYGKPICCGLQCSAAIMVCLTACAACSTGGVCSKAHGRRKSP